MLFPDAKRRTVLGWQIRWVAGLFCLLMFAAGSVPAYVTNLTELTERTEFDHELRSQGGAFAETGAGERLSQLDSFPASVECLQSSATGESEIETEETGASASLSRLRLSCFHDVNCAAQHDPRRLPSTDAARSRFSRAPPLA